MANKGLVAQITREAPNASMRESAITPTLLPICCLCRKVRDETGSSSDREHWVTPQTYRQTHGVQMANSPLTHTFCPQCFTKFMDTVRQYHRGIRSSP